MLIKETAYAKINLALAIKEKRKDSYHEVELIMAPINLFDELYFEKLAEDKIVIDGPFSNINIEDNFIYKAAKLIKYHYNIKDGVYIKVIKNIPVMAGLAGGSSDASATLRGLNRLFDLKIPLRKLLLLASKLGSDMPYCVLQTLSLCTGRGEKVKPLDINYEEIDITLIKPNLGISTKEVYMNYTYNEKNRIDNYKNIIQGLKENDYDLLNENIFNDLTSVSLSLNNDYLNLYNLLSQNYKVFISGSGPTMFILGHHDIKLPDDVFFLKTNIMKNTR